MCTQQKKCSLPGEKAGTAGEYQNALKEGSQNALGLDDGNYSGFSISIAISRPKGAFAPTLLLGRMALLVLVLLLTFLVVSFL